MPARPRRRSWSRARNGALFVPDGPMSSSSQKTISPAGWPADIATRGGARLRRRLSWARFILFVERAMPALWPAIGIMGLYFALALSGLFTITPWLIQSLILAAAITAMGLALDDGFRDFHLPTQRDAARRLERDNKLLHRPISEGDDLLLAGSSDPVAQRLWALHRARTLPDKLRF